MRLSTVIIIIAATCLLQGLANAFWQNTINTGLQGMRRAECQRLRRTNRNVQFPNYCKVTSVKIVVISVGSRQYRVTSGQLAFVGLVLRTADVKFVTEQNGGGSIRATFNGATLQCTGFSMEKRKECTIPSRLRPWSGSITVQVQSNWRPSMSFQMRGKLYCSNPGFEGNNCNRDVNECVKYKDKQLCAWKPGCVNTIGSYKCTCPPGYKVSAADFRLCVKDTPKISTRPSTVTVMFMQTATLRCRHTSSGPVVLKWQIGKRVIAIKRPNGVKQTVDPQRLTLQDNGDLIIKQVKYGDMGHFVCVVQNAHFGAFVTHKIAVESSPLMDAQFLVSGNHTRKHAYRVGDDVTIDCEVLAMPVPAITWMKGQQQLTTGSGRVKVTLGPIPNNPVPFAGALQLKLQITRLTTSDAGVYTCKANNKHGANTRTIALTVN